jgi:hypothetical protein
MREGTEHCDSCRLEKHGVGRKKLIHGIASLCSECMELTRWSSVVLEVGTNHILRKMPESYIRSSKLSVTPL